MKVILLHNDAAGQNNQPSADEILRAIRDAGHSVIYQSTREPGAKWTMLEPADLVAAAGGDGTVRKAALGVAGRRTPLAILPLGTANNLARAFGIQGSVARLVEGWEGAVSRQLDVGMAVGPWGKKPFIESAGAGLLATVMDGLSRGNPGSAAPSLERAYGTLREALTSHRARKWIARVDDREISENLLLVEAMNISSAGPNICLSPQSDPGDGLLDFVFLPESRRAAFAAFLDAPMDCSHPPPVEFVRGRSLHLRSNEPDAIHIDDFTWLRDREHRNQDSADTGESALTFDICLMDDPVEVWTPKPPEEI